MDNKTTYYQFKIGDRVSVKEQDEAYDDAPPITPNMVGTIKAFPPKVRKVKGPLLDNKDYFAYIIFDEKYTRGNHTYDIRAGIDLCNLKKVKS